MVEQDRRQILSAIGGTSLLGTSVTGIASASPNRGVTKTKRKRLPDSTVRRMLGRVNSYATFRETREFLRSKTQRLNRQDTVGYEVRRPDGTQYRELRTPLQTQNGTGTLRVMTDGTNLETQSNIPEAGSSLGTYFCNRRVLRTASEPVEFERWVDINETSGSSLKDGVSTTDVQPPGQCVKLGGSDLCAAVDLLGLAAGAIVAALEPSPSGELVILDRLGTVAKVFGTTAATCSALELIDGLYNCESDRYYVCPRLITLFTGYVKIVPACTLD